MRSFVVASLAVLMVVCATGVSAREWRNLRIDASSQTRFNESVQQMRDTLPYNRALLFGLVLKDLQARLTPAAYRQQLDGLTYKQIASLASPNVTAEYLAHYYGGGAGGRTMMPDAGGFSSSVPNPFGVFPGFDSNTGQPLLAQ
ncbi:MAG TPA: hypothetical protein VHH11_17260 [Gammaproteobacteria bacterium]|nr:hypothetical protein [Gammaproteobacteria bacterium]